MQIQGFEALREQRHVSLRNVEDQYRVRFQLPPNPAIWRTSAKSCELELCFFQKSYEDILLDLRELQSFNAVNEAAVLRLFDKFIASRPDRAKFLEDAKDQWLAKQHAANQASHNERLIIFEFVCVLREVRADARPASMSLGEQALMRHQLPEEYDAKQLYQFCVKDDAAMLESVIRRCSDPSVTLGTTLGDFIGDILILAMLLKSNNTTTMLLLTTRQENLALSTQHVSVILALWRSRPEDKEFSRLLAETLCDTAAISNFLPGCFKPETPLLHHAAQYGYVELYGAFIKKASEAGSLVLEALLLRDSHNKTPLHYAAISSNTVIFSEIITTITKNDSHKSLFPEFAKLLGELLLLAVRMNHREIAEIILGQHVDVKVTSFASETALYAASQSGSVEMVHSIVKYMLKTGEHLNEKTRDSGWTSLMVACANGHQKVASHLLAAGADPSLKDARGWTAQEHAVFRGHLAVSELSALAVVGDAIDGPARCNGFVQDTTPTVLSPGQKAIIVNLGSVQGGHERAALRLLASDTKNSHEPKEPVALMLEISMPGNESHWVPVPLLQDYTNEPFVFLVDEGTPAQIIVRLYHWNSPRSKLLLSGGTVVLGQDGEKFGSKRESMLRETTVFLMKKDAMEPAGTVLLSYVVAKGFAGLQSPCSSNYRRQPAAPPRLIGHRGSSQVRKH